MIRPRNTSPSGLRLDPKLGDDRQAQHRYHAVCYAALAAAGQGRTARLDDAAKAKLRRQAFDWLKAELTAWNQSFDSGPPQDRPAILRTLNWWWEDTDLAGVRDEAALAKLPADERKEWRALWARVPGMRTVVPTCAAGAEVALHHPAAGGGLAKAEFDDKQWPEGVGGFGSWGRCRASAPSGRPPTSGCGASSRCRKGRGTTCCCCPPRR